MSTGRSPDYASGYADGIAYAVAVLGKMHDEEIEEARKASRARPSVWNAALVIAEERALAHAQAIDALRHGDVTVPDGEEHGLVLPCYASVQEGTLLLPCLLPEGHDGDHKA